VNRDRSCGVIVENAPCSYWRQAAIAARRMLAGAPALNAAAGVVAVSLIGTPWLRMHWLNLSCWEARPDGWPPAPDAAVDDRWLLEPHAAIETVMPTVANATTYRRTVCIRKGLLLSRGIDEQ
jgi:hypothetical protein